MSAICHLVCLDEIHKMNLIKQISKNISIIDLDSIQLFVQKSPEIRKEKMIWSKISSKIYTIKKKQQILCKSGTSKIKYDKQIFENQIKRQINLKNKTKIKIHNIWKNKMLFEIKKKINLINNNYIFVGFNIYPKDYRIKVDLDLDKSSKINNCIAFDIHSKLYAANQIKYYLHAYSNKIINGEFPLNLLKIEYLCEKYDKIVNYYSKKNYILKNKHQIINYIENINLKIKENIKLQSISKSIFTHGSNITSLCNTHTNTDNKVKIEDEHNIDNIKIIGGKHNINNYTKIEDKYNVNENDVVSIDFKLKDNHKCNTKSTNKKNVIYVPTMFKTGNIIPVNKTTPIQGYYSKKEAIDAMKLKIKNCKPIYIHKTTPDNFYLINGCLMSKFPIFSYEEESILVT